MNLPPALNQSQGQSPMGQMPNPMMGPQGGMGTTNNKLVAYFSKEELMELISMMPIQNVEEIIDPSTGLIDLSPLEPILSNPEIETEILEDASQGNTKKYADGGTVGVGRPIVPELEELREEGTGDHTELAILTPKLMDIFIQWNNGEIKENPHNGVPEFFSFRNFLKSAVRVVTTTMGPITGFLGSKLTGQSTGAALKNAGIGAGLALTGLTGTGTLGSMLGGANTTGGGLLSSLGGGAGKMLGMNAIGNMVPQGGNVAQNAIGQGMGQAPGQGGGFLSSLASNALPLGIAGLMAYKGRQQEQKALHDYEQKQKDELEALRNKSGFGTPWKKPKAYSMEKAEGEISPEDLASGKHHQYFKHAPLGKIEYELKEGGAIHGTGKGQQDNIRKDLPEGAYILDASTVSDFGDGSSQAGIKELDRFFSRRPHKDMNNISRQEKRGGYIEALVSPDEYEVPSEEVTALGKGSNARGAKILEDMVKKLRRQKRTSGNRLPPKSKPINNYLRNLSVA